MGIAVCWLLNSLKYRCKNLQIRHTDVVNTSNLIKLTVIIVNKSVNIKPFSTKKGTIIK